MQKLDQLLPVVLTVAGSDSSAGAGIQADLRTFDRLGVVGTSAITAITAQSLDSIISVENLSPKIVADQLTAIASSFKLAAIKSGMLVNHEIIHTLATFVNQQKIPYIVDPVMVSTSGRPLLSPSAIESLKEELLPLATLVTPNIPELATIIDRPLTTVNDVECAGRELAEKYGNSWLIKGGHISYDEFGRDKVADLAVIDGKCQWLVADSITTLASRGTGCTLASAIAANMAKGLDHLEAIKESRKFLQNLLQVSGKVGDNSYIMWGQSDGK